MRSALRGPAMIDRRSLGVWVISVLAGLLADLAGLPGGWLVGALLATLVLSLRWRVRAGVPPLIYLAAQAVLGAALSGSFSSSSLSVLGSYWAPVLVVLVLVLGLSLLGGLLLRRLGHLDPATASLGMLPGGAGGMVAMSDDLGADARLVAFVQYARLVSVVLLASAVANFVGVSGLAGGSPAGAAIAADAETGWAGYGLTALAAVFGAWAGARLRIPAGAMIGPMMLGLGLGALGLPHGAWPPGVLEASYIVIGMAVGSRFDAQSARHVGQVAPSVLAVGLALIAACALMGWGLAALTGMDPLTAYLATTPGGMDSVTVAALDTGADASLVVAVQLIRLLIVVLAGPPLVRWLVRRGTPAGSVAPPSRVEDVEPVSTR